MRTTVSLPSTSKALDITQEKKDLKSAVIEKEALYGRVSRELEQLQSEIADFQVLYDSKIGRLYARLNELENLLFKYEHISEHVDDIFSFSEAEKVFEDTMRERWKRMEDEFYKRNRLKKSGNKKNDMSVRYREELKLLYRALARAFHPDKNGGDEEMMKQINKAYREGNLQQLRALDLKHGGKKENETFASLKHRLEVLTGLIQRANKEIRSLQKSEMYTQKVSAQSLDTIAEELTREIVRKEKQVAEYEKTFGIEEKRERGA